MPAAKTIRFAKVVEECGRPEPYTLWADPEKDATFKSALRANRIMTVSQKTMGSEADYGEVGYKRGKSGELLLFPKSLKAFEGKRIVGIKYDLLKQPAAGKQKAKGPMEPRKTRKVKEHLPANTIPFPKAPGHDLSPADCEKALAEIKRQVGKALEALSADRPVAAYKILERLIESAN